MLDLSERLSRPCSNGMNPNIDIKIPVFTQNQILNGSCDSNLIFVHNTNKELITIDCVTTNRINTIRKKLEDMCNNNYLYMNIMNLKNDNFLLLILTNDTTLLKKHMLLRKITLPSYYSGIHPYWNANGLLFYNNEYKVLEL